MEQALIEESKKLYPQIRSSSTGTSVYHVSNIFTKKALVHTDGVEEVCKDNKCYWILDVIASYFSKYKEHYCQTDNHFFAVEIIRNPNDSSAHFTINDGYVDGFNITQEIPYTDLKGNVQMFMQGETLEDNTVRFYVMMPEEY